MRRLVYIPKKEDRKLIYFTIDPRQYGVFIKESGEEIEVEIENYCGIIRDNLGMYGVYFNYTTKKRI